MIGRFKADPVKLTQLGLTLYVYMQPLNQADSPVGDPQKSGALLDTGSHVCGINPETGITGNYVDSALNGGN
jgi:hypothetical protein